jgi:DNA-binding transcriptional MocR family regulator
LRGTPQQRALLADWLSRTRIETSADAILLCVGAQQGIHLAFSDLRRLSKSIASEAATFTGAIAAAADLGMQWQPVDHDDQGMTADDLDRVLTESDCRIVYTTPVCQNPLGVEAGDARRREILRVCSRHDACIVEDDIYGMYAARSRLTYKELAPERVYYLTSLSKCLTPLVRAGILAPPPDRLVAVVRTLRAQVWGAAPLALETACALIELGADRTAADALCKEAKLRMTLAARLLGLENLPMPHGAPHLWLPMPAVDAEKLARRASGQGVRLTPPDASSIGGPKSGGVRLCILAPPRREDLERALKVVSALRSEPEETVV